MAGGTKPTTGTRRAERCKDGHRKSGGIGATKQRGPAVPQPQTAGHNRRAASTKDSTMKLATVPALQVKHSAGTAWRIVATWPDGRSEEIANFKNEAEANAWISEDFLDWLERRTSSQRRA